MLGGWKCDASGPGTSRGPLCQHLLPFYSFFPCLESSCRLTSSSPSRSPDISTIYSLFPLRCLSLLSHMTGSQFILVHQALLCKCTLLSSLSWLRMMCDSSFGLYQGFILWSTWVQNRAASVTGSSSSTADC